MAAGVEENSSRKWWTPQTKGSSPSKIPITGRQNTRTKLPTCVSLLKTVFIFKLSLLILPPLPLLPPPQPLTITAFPTCAYSAPAPYYARSRPGTRSSHFVASPSASATQLASLCLHLPFGKQKWEQGLKEKKSQRDADFEGEGNTALISINLLFIYVLFFFFCYIFFSYSTPKDFVQVLYPLPKCGYDYRRISSLSHSRISPPAHSRISSISK